MFQQITNDFHTKGRMHLLTPVKKKLATINKEFDEDAKKHTALFLASMYNIICINDIILGLATEAFSKIKKTPLYKHSLKRKINEVEKLIKSYEKVINRITINCSDNYAEANDTYFTAELENAIERLRLLFKNIIDKHNIAYSNELAWLEIVRLMIDYSVVIKNAREQDLNKVTHRGCIYFHALDLCRIQVVYEQIYNYIKLGCSVQLNTPDTKAMFNYIDKLCNDTERIQNTINQMSKEVKDENGI